VRSEIIWCLSGGTRVYAKTQKGEMPITLKDLVRLRPETVQLWTGECWTQVLGWSRAEDREGALEIELRSGERIGCTGHHQWPTQRGLVRADDLRVGDVLQTCRLPEPAAASPEALDDRLVGWVCGLYLAEGSRNRFRHMRFAGHRDQTVYRLPALQRFAEAYHGTVWAHVGRGNAASIQVEGGIPYAVVNAYVGGSSARTKHLKPACWDRSDDFLRALLDGYLAGDGSRDVANDRWRLAFTRNDALAADLRTLAARLGATLTLQATSTAAWGKRWPIYRGELRWTRSGHHSEKDRATVVAIRRSRARQFWHVGVADEPHLFALASGVLTANSKPNPMPESVKDRCTRAHETVFMLARRPRYYYDQDAIREPHASSLHKFTTEALRYRTQGKHLVVQHAGDASRFSGGQHPAGRNARSVWTVATAPLSSKKYGLDMVEHYAAFPPELVRPMIRAGTSEHGVCGAMVKKLRLRSDLTPEAQARVMGYLRRRGLAS
jgi:hypothetical protein